MGKRFALKI